MIEGKIKYSESLKIRAIDLMLSLAYMFILKILMKYFVSQYENFLL